MKKLRNSFLFVIFIGILFCLPWLGKDLYQGHDLRFHAARLRGIVSAWQDGQWIPRVYPYMNNGYGYGTPLFYGDYFLYPFALLYRLGLPLVVSFKLMMISASIASAASAFYVAKKIFSSSKEAPYLFTCFYLFSHYHLLTAHVRYALGEVFALIWIPFLLYAMWLVFLQKEDHWILLGISFTLLLLSHNLSFLLYVLFFGVVYIVSAVYTLRKKESIFPLTSTCLKAGILALGLSAFFLWPMVEQLTALTLMVEHYSVLYNLRDTAQSFSSIFTFLLTKSSHHSLFFTQMSMGLPLVFLPVFLLFRKQKPKHFILLGILHIFLLIFMTGILIPPGVTLFNTLQFLFRLYMLAYPLACYSATYYLIHIKKKFLSVASLVVLLMVFGNLIPFYRDLQTSPYQIQNTDTPEVIFDFRPLLGQASSNYIEISGGEYLPYVPNAVSYLSDPRHIHEGGQVVVNRSEYRQKGSCFEFLYTSDRQREISLPQIYYEGYQAFRIQEDGTREKLITFPSTLTGLVTFRIPQGEGHYLSCYEGTNIQKISLLISVITFLLLNTYLIYVFYKEKRKLKDSLSCLS